MYLGPTNGYLQDWVTQLWVRASGRTQPVADLAWLVGPTGGTATIADTYIGHLAQQEGLVVRRNVVAAGLLPSLAVLGLPADEQARLHPEVEDFYTHTGGYEMDVWYRWYPPFKIGYQLLVWLYSRRLKQLNLPLAPLDAAFGLQSEIVQLVDASNTARYTLWYRTIRRTGQVIYSGSYGYAQPPNSPRTCLKVVFPLPNGNATVLLRPEVTPAGGLLLVSQGRAFGDPGFYFTVRRPGNRLAANYVRGMHETIHVYHHTDGALRTDHIFRLFGTPFLHLHYRLRNATK